MRTVTEVKHRDTGVTQTVYGKWTAVKSFKAKK